MRIQNLLVFLGLQVLAIIWAGLSFAVIESRVLAGALAGGYFILSGLYMVGKLAQDPKRWSFLMWYPLLVHVFVISIPMVITRFLNTDKAFADVRILGMEGPTFHRLSTTIFGLLVLGTLIDLARTYRARTIRQ